MLIAMQKIGIRPDAIVFADTGNEHPKTYEFLERFDSYLSRVDFPEITVVRAGSSPSAIRPRKRTLKQIIGNPKLSLALTYSWLENHVKQTFGYTTLGDECLLLESLPAKAMGRSACSDKWKIKPIRHYLNEKYGCWVEGVGIHAGEVSRVLDKNTGQIRETPEHIFQWYPMIEWKIDQYVSEALCKEYLGEVPRKSSCWFCPNMKLAEVMELKNDYPELFELGCFMERQAMPHVTSKAIKGLGRNFSWNQIDELTPIEQQLIDIRKYNQNCSCTD